MEYKTELDEKVYSEELKINGYTLKVEAYRYNKSNPKIQISRLKGDRHLKLGRLALKEVEMLVPVLDKLKSELQPILESNDPKEDVVYVIDEPQKEEVTTPKEETKPEIKKEPVPEQIQEFKMVLADTVDFIENIKSCSQIITECKWVIDANGITFVSICPANVSMIQFYYYSSAFVEYYINKKTDFVMNINQFYDILKNVTKKDIIKISYFSEDKIQITLSGDIERNYILATIRDPTYKDQKIPDLKFGGTIFIDDKMFASGINEINKVSDSVTFITTKNKFSLESNSDKEVGIHFDKTDITLFKDDIKSKYSVDYLMKMCIRKNYKKSVCVEYGTDYPLRLTYSRMDKWRVVYILAPRVEND